VLFKTPSQPPGTFPAPAVSNLKAVQKAKLYPKDWSP
jgi:hypothetical protein